MIRLAIVEDDIEMSKSLRDFLLGDPALFHEIRLFESAEDIIKEIKLNQYQPQVILQDIQLPGMSGLDAIVVYRKYIPDTKILMNSVLQDSEHVFKAICNGALGYIEKGYTLEKIKESIISVMHGGSPMSPSIARHVINYFNPSKKFEEELSPREREVVQGILDGLSYKMIAEKNYVSIDTIRTHITRIYRKLQINSKGELISKYLNKKD
jgi:DNA-binding NarL/FixJ family response regulator